MFAEISAPLNFQASGHPRYHASSHLETLLVALEIEPISCEVGGYFCLFLPKILSMQHSKLVACFAKISKTAGTLR